MTRFPPAPRKGAVALSGGLDSSVLLYEAVQDLGPDYVVALHIDHQARELESCQAECQSVERLCAKLGVTLRRKTLARREKTSEESLRDLRYAALVELSTDCDWVALAHHRDDQVETILMNLFRGGDRRGWGGMPQFFSRQSSLFVRPFLQSHARSDLVKIQSELGLPIFEDPSNDSACYLRNRYRRELLPLIEELAPQARAKILDFGRAMENWTIFLDHELEERSAGEVWKFVEEGVWSFPRKILQGWPRLILEAWCHRSLCEFSKKAGSITRAQVEDLAEWIASEELGAYARPFPANVRFRARKREILCLMTGSPTFF